jgi:hypothetical protein
MSKQEAALRAFHNSFGERTRNVMAYVDELIEQWRSMKSGRIRGGYVGVVDRVGPPVSFKSPPPSLLAPPRLNDGEDYQLEQYPGETFRDGQQSPGV